MGTASGKSRMKSRTSLLKMAIRFSTGFPPFARFSVAVYPGAGGMNHVLVKRFFGATESKTLTISGPATMPIAHRK